MKRIPFLPLRRGLAGTRAFRGLRPTVQETAYTCGPAALQCVLSLAGRRTTERSLMRRLATNKRHGTTPAAMLAEAQRLRLKPSLLRGMTTAELVRAVRQGFPVIVLWGDWGGHWAVVVGYHEAKRTLLLADPASRRYGLRCFTQEAFRRHWKATVAGVRYQGLGLVCRGMP